MNARSGGPSVDWLVPSRHDVRVTAHVGNLVKSFYDELWNRWQWLTSAWVLGDLDGLRHQLS